MNQKKYIKLRNKNDISIFGILATEFDKEIGKAGIIYVLPLLFVIFPAKVYIILEKTGYCS